MGAHNLGEAHFGNSGFSGTWVSNEQVWQGLIKHQHECYSEHVAVLLQQSVLHQPGQHQPGLAAGAVKLWN